MSKRLVTYYEGGRGRMRLIRYGHQRQCLKFCRREEGKPRFGCFDDLETVPLVDGWRGQKALDAHHASRMMRRHVEPEGEGGFVRE